MKLKLFPIIGILALGNLMAQALDLPKATVEIRVLDQNGKPVPGGHVKLAGATSPNPTSDIFKEGDTNEKGIFQTEVKSNGEIHVSAEKSGFYGTEMPSAYNFKITRGSAETAFAKGFWEPRPLKLDLILKKVVKPIPMFARVVETKIPADGEKIGFDLEKGDWVTPYGQGDNADMFFIVARKINGDTDYSATLKLSFPRAGDGIVSFKAPEHEGSVFRSPYEAPIEGYEPEKTWTFGRSPNAPGSSDTFIGGSDNDIGYMFRVRTVLDKDGKVKDALYGKIYGDIRFYVGTSAPKAGIGFNYYLNPISKDRNLEFSTDQNLFKALQLDNQISAP